VTKRLWFNLAAVTAVAEHAASCNQFRAFGAAGRRPCLLVDTAGGGRIGSNGRSDTPSPAWLPASYVDGREERHEPTPAVLLPLTDPDPQPWSEPSLLDVLRAGVHRRMHWFTIEVASNGAVTHTVVASRQRVDLPADVSWVPAHVAAGELGPYPAQIAAGYHRPGGSAFARFTRDVAWWIALDIRHLPRSRQPGEAIRVVDEQVRRMPPAAGGERANADVGEADGWWRIDGPAWPWTVADHDEYDAPPEPSLTQTWGPDGDQERCVVCHAVDDLDHDEMPSMVGYGHDTWTRCRRCGSTETTDPMFGIRVHPAPWPPPRARQTELDRDAPTIRRRP